MQNIREKVLLNEITLLKDEIINLRESMKTLEDKYDLDILIKK